MNLTTQYFDVTGGRIAFDDTLGEGTPVVLIPGMLEARTTFRHLRPLLVAAGHRVITMDVRGFGETSIEWDDYSPAAMGLDALALLDHLGIERAVLAGSSYAGASVVKAAGTAPERVAGIVLLDGFIENLPQNAFQRALVRTMGMVVENVPSVWGFYLKKMAYPTAKPADFDDYVAKAVAALRTPGRRVATHGHVTGDSSPVGWSPAVQSPALIVMGTKDPDFPKPEVVADRQVAAMNGRKVMIEGAGHYPAAEFPQATADAMLSFLTEVG